MIECFEGVAKLCCLVVCITQLWIILYLNVLDNRFECADFI